jgi:hypothetical protein
MKTTSCEFSALPGAIVLLKRLLKLHPNSVVSINNMHRMMVVIFLVADKFLEDVPASNALFASGSELKCQDLKEIELEFLAMLNYDAFISMNEIESVLKSWGFKIESNLKCS